MNNNYILNFCPALLVSIPLSREPGELERQRERSAKPDGGAGYHRLRRSAATTPELLNS